MQWVRWYHDTTTDRKFKRVSRATGQTLERVVFTWAVVLEAASDNSERGRCDIQPDDVADILGCEEDAIASIFKGMADQKLISFPDDAKGILVTAFNARNKQSDNAATRQADKRKRDKEAADQKAAEGKVKSKSPVTVTTASRDRNADVTPLESDLDLDSESPLKPPRGGGAKKRDRGNNLPEEWEPDADGCALAKSLGLDVDSTLAQFRDHYAGMTGAKARSADWQAWWRKWCRGAPQRRKPNTSSGYRGSSASEFVGRDEAKQWRARLNGQIPGEKSGYWAVEQWGPRPGEPGCLVPPAILAEFGFDTHTTH